MSPDGTHMAYVANNRLYLRSISELEGRAIRGTENPGGTLTNPVFSPDGRSIVFYSGPTGTGGAIERIAVTGGAALTICTANNSYGMRWDHDAILFGQGADGILRVPAGGGKPEVIARVRAGELAHGPQMLPDGQNLLFTVASGTTRWDTAQIVIQSLASGERKTLIQGGRDARYVPTGHIVYALGGTLLAVPFDVRRLEVMSGPVPIIEGVRRAVAATGTAHFSVSDTGTLMYIPGPASLLSDQQVLALVDRTGIITPLKLQPGSYRHARMSPDGKRVAFSADDGKEVNVFVYELNGATSMRRLTFGGNNRFPIWARDGERIAFQSDRETDLAIWWQRADTSGTAERLTKPDERVGHVPESWSPTDDRFLYTATSGASVTLWTFSLRDRKGTRFDTVESSNPIGSVFSPDGRWVAYSTANTIYVQPFPPTGTLYQLSKNDAGYHPMWSSDGTELFYEPGANQLAVLGVQTRPTFSFANPVPLPDVRVGTTSPAFPRNRDIDPTGKRFISPVSVDEVQAGTSIRPEIRVVLNWFEELKQRVPVP